MDKKAEIKHGQPGSMEYILRSMVSKSDKGIVKLSPGSAKKILEELNFPGQRKIDTGRVFGHGRNIVKGDWLESFSIDFVCLPDGRIWMVDGQHRLTAISELEAPTSVTIRLIDCDSEKDAKWIYAGYDQRKSVRTNNQILDAIGIAQEVGLSRNMASSVFDAASILINNMEPITGSVNARKHPEAFLHQTKIDVIQEWADEARKYEGISKKAKTALLLKMRSSGVVAVALYTLRHQPSKAVEFWTGVAENDGLKKNDPRAALIFDLLSRVVGVGNIRQKVQQSTVAWNAWCEGRPLSIIKCVPGGSLTLWGTPLKAVRK